MEGYRILKPGMMLKSGNGSYFALLLSRQAVDVFIEDWFILIYHHDGDCWFSCEPIRRHENDSSWEEVKKT